MQTCAISSDDIKSEIHTTQQRALAPLKPIDKSKKLVKKAKKLVYEKVSKHVWKLEWANKVF